MVERIKKIGFINEAFFEKKHTLVLLALFLFPVLTVFAKTARTIGNENSDLSFSNSENNIYLLPFSDDSQRNNKGTSCPIVLFIEPLADICIDSAISPFQLTVTIQGSDGSGFGVWSGGGIIDPVNGVFDPLDSLAIIGDNLITYTFIENGCIIAENTTITLHGPPDASFSADSPLCTNDFSNIIAVSTAGGHYEWNFSGGNINAGNDEGPYEISWLSADSYLVSLVVTDQHGCTSSESQTIEVEKPLDIPIIDCFSTTTEIVFNWNDVPDALDHEVLLLNGPVGIEDLNLYSVSNLMSGGDSVTIQVSAVGPLPCGNSVAVKTCYTNDCPPLVVNIQPVPDICLDGTVSNIELEANIENYDAPGIWSGNGIIDEVVGIFDPHDPSINYGPNKIFVTFTEEACGYKDSITINVFEVPIADAGVADEITCAIKEIALTGNAIGTNLEYNWTGPGIVSGFNSLFPVINQPGTYFLKATDTLSSCAFKDSIVVTIDHNVPIADAGNDKEITCDSSTVVLEGSSSFGQNFQYIWHGPDINAGNLNDQNPVVSIPGYYVLEVLETVNDCYSPKDSVYVAENTQAPLADITQAIDVVNCEILSNHLIGNTILNGAYQWFDESSQLLGNSSSLVAGEQGFYIYSITNTQNGCVGFDTIIVAENISYPTASLSVSGSLDCDTKEVILDGSNSFYGQNIVYSWTSSTNGIVDGFNANIAVVVSPGNYNLTVLDTLNNCSNEIAGTVLQVFNEPTAIIRNLGEIDCNLSEVDLDGSGSVGIDSLNYQWLYHNTIVGQEPIVSVSNSGNYSLIVSNMNSNCADTSFIKVAYNAPPIEHVDIDISTPSCYGENDGILVFDSVVGGTPYYLFSIDGGQNFVSFNQFYNIESGHFDFIIKDAKGCQWDTSLIVEQPTELNLDIGDDLVLQMGDTLTLSASFNIPENQVDTIIWYPNDILHCSLEGECYEVFGQPTNSFYARAALIDLNGCIIKDKIKIELDKERIAFVPNIFSPNGDNKNDKFTIYAGNSVKQIKHFSVYNRWGKTIYEGTNFLPNDPAYGWDGTLNGKPLGPDVFVYWAEIELIDGQKTIFKGEVTLIK